jgi:hypothetical protein
MDKKQDRQFYWEVKDFMSSKKKINENVNKPSRVVDSVKTILEQNKPYKQSTNGSNSNTVNTIRQALDQIQNNEKRFKPECKAFTKNMDTNPFRSLNEGWWDDLVGGLTAKAKDFLPPSKTMSGEQSQERARQNKIRSAMARSQDQFDLEQSAGGSGLTSADLEKEIENQVTKPGVPLTAEQMRMRELSGKLKREEGLNQIAADEAERREVGAPDVVTTGSGRQYSPKPSWVPDSQIASPEETQAAAAEETPAAPTPVSEPAQTSGDQTFVGKDITQQTPDQIAAMNDPNRGGQSGIFGDKPTKPNQAPSDQDKQKYIEGRKSYWANRNQQRRQEAEERLVRMGQIDMSKQSASGRGTIAVNRLRAQRELQGSKDMSDEKIAGMAQREAEIKFRTPEQKAAKDAENRSVVADLAKRADEVRRKEAETKMASQSQTGTKTQSTSQTAPKTYRI